MKETFFISTAIDYPSEKPHLGHCLEKIQADVIARYKRLQGFEVHFSTGLDEHGLKIQRYAQRAKKRPREFVNEMSRHFKNLWKALNISNDDFIRTTDKRHEKVVQKIIKKINEKGDIYKGKYKGLYCLDCESYYLPKDLKDSKCPFHHKPVELIQEKTYFFRMSKYQKQLLKHIKENKNFIIPENRKNEILSRLKNPLQDLSITRKTVKWGIPFPFEKRLTLFVWVDALINYLTTIDYPNNKFKRFWPANVHVIGKDILWHHSVIWSSLLLSLGLPLPKTIFVHGFVTVSGQKMSKSLGNIIDPFELVKKYGTDAVRYFLLREILPTEDGDFTYEKFERRYNSDLASGLGNLVARTMKLVQISNTALAARQARGEMKKNSSASFQFPISDQFPNSEFKTIINNTWGKYKKSLDNFKFNEALISIWNLISFCDKYIERKQPWRLLSNSKSQIPTQKLKEILSNLLFAIDNIAKMLEPLLPETSEKILIRLGQRPTTKKIEGFGEKKEKPLFLRLGS